MLDYWMGFFSAEVCNMAPVFKGGLWSGRGRCGEHPFSVVHILLAWQRMGRWKGCAHVSDCCDSPSTMLPSISSSHTFSICSVLNTLIPACKQVWHSFLCLRPSLAFWSTHRQPLMVLRSLLWWYVAYSTTNHETVSYIFLNINFSCSFFSKFPLKYNP